MTDISGTATATATTQTNKLAMSRALGAAFLNHQVEQLERTVTNGPSSGNWRDRERDYCRQSPTGGVLHNGSGANTKRPSVKPLRKKGTHAFVVERREKREARNSNEYARTGKEKEKDADIVVVDASVLVHALHQVKQWCREGRDEVVIVPLEALNTLDLLKKGTSPLAQRARAASRILEAQVGTNPRIRVQQDDAFVLWDKIAFKDLTAPPTTAESEKEKLLPVVAQTQSTQGSPEWVRRTICCAQWEVDNSSPKESSSVENDSTTLASTEAPKKVLLAVLSASVLPNSASPLSQSTVSVEVTPSPVPLPAPHHPQHPGKHEARSSGTLVGYWAAKAGIEMLEVKPTPPSIGGGVTSEDEEATGRKRSTTAGRGRGSDSGRGNKRDSVGRGGGTKSDLGRGGGMVERPPAVMAMMEMVSQPTKVRLLARGEKLDPDP